MRLIARNVFVVLLVNILLIGCAIPSYADLNPPYTSNEENLDADNLNMTKKIGEQIELLLPSAEVKVASSNFNVLIIGEVASQSDKDKLTSVVKGQRDVKKVWNYTTVSSSPHLYYNSRLVKEVRARIALEKNIAPDQIIVNAVGNTVYLLGTNIGNLTYLKKSIRGIYTIDGVSQVVNLTQVGPKDYYSLEKDSY